MSCQSAARAWTGNTIKGRGRVGEEWSSKGGIAGRYSWFWMSHKWSGLVLPCLVWWSWSRGAQRFTCRYSGCHWNARSSDVLWCLEDELLPPPFPSLHVAFALCESLSIFHLKRVVTLSVFDVFVTLHSSAVVIVTINVLFVFCISFHLPLFLFSYPASPAAWFPVCIQHLKNKVTEIEIIWGSTACFLSFLHGTMINVALPGLPFVEISSRTFCGSIIILIKDRTFEL